MGSMSHTRQESPGFSRGEEFKQLVDMQDELNDIECYANGELDFGGDF